VQTLEQLIESRDACQKENSRLALAKQELSVFLDEAIKDRDYYDGLRKTAEQQVATITEALELVEWVNYQSSDYGKYCLDCGRFQQDGHRNGCRIGGALAAVRVERK
jgi:hypothetical protein